MNVIYLSQMEELGLPPLSHIKFNLAIGHHLVDPIIEARSVAKSMALPIRRPLLAHGPAFGKLRRKCLECEKRSRWFCVGCGYVTVCPRNCFNEWHERIARQRQVVGKL